MRRFEVEYMGRGWRDVHAFLIGDLVLVRMKGVLTAAEQHLAKSQTAEKGRDLVKQVRSHLVEAARPEIEAMIQLATGVPVVSLHHDISITTGEMMIVFTLKQVPAFRELKNGRDRYYSSQPESPQTRAAVS